MSTFESIVEMMPLKLKGGVPKSYYSYADIGHSYGSNFYSWVLQNGKLLVGDKNNYNFHRDIWRDNADAEGNQFSGRIDLDNGAISIQQLDDGKESMLKGLIKKLKSLHGRKYETFDVWFYPLRGAPEKLESEQENKVSIFESIVEEYLTEAPNFLEIGHIGKNWIPWFLSRGSSKISFGKKGDKNFHNKNSTKFEGGFSGMIDLGKKVVSIATADPMFSDRDIDKILNMLAKKYGDFKKYLFYGVGLEPVRLESFEGYE